MPGAVAAAPFVGEVPPGAVVAAREDPDAEHTEDAADAVHGDRAHRVVDALALEEQDRLDDDDRSDDADDRGRPRLHERTRRRDRHQAGEHAVRHHAGVGLPEPLHGVEHAHRRPERRRDGGVRRHEREAHVGGRERRRRVEPEPAEQQDEGARHAPSGCCAPPACAASRRARTCRSVVPAPAHPRGRRCRPSCARRRSRRSRRSRSRAPCCCRAGSASRRPTSRRRTAGSRSRRRTAPSRRTRSTSSARPWRRWEWSRWCP